MSTFINEKVSKLNSTLLKSFEKSLQKSFSCLNEKEQFLYQATQSLDTIDAVQQYLKKYEQDYKSVEAESLLEWLFVAQCTITIYGQVFSNVLNLTLPISKSIDYWSRIHGNTWKEMYYALQVSPIRVYDLLKNTLKEFNSKTIGMKDVKSLVTSSDYILSQLFPAHNSNRQCHIFKSFSLNHRPVFLEILRNEIHLKKVSLQQFRTEQATALGLLLLNSPQYDGDFITTVSIETKNCIEMIKHVLHNRNPAHFQQQNIQPTSPSEIISDLNLLVKTWLSSYHNRSQTIQSLYSAPCRLTRYWIPALISYVVGGWAIRYGVERQKDFFHYIAEFGKTAHDFVLNWIWNPILKVYNTIRLRDERLSLLSKEGLQSDLNSLERMVVGFAKDHLHLSESELSLVASNVREGDISVLLYEYEKEIKNPLKNAITGDLLQAILIQVQKTKVDVDLAMSALDKLLKSNELNFAFLAVAPSMLFTWASVYWLKNRLQGRTKHKLKKIGLPIKETLRRIERQLVNSQGQNKCETQGLLLCEIHLLRSYAITLPIRNSIQSQFLEDIRDLENPSLSNYQKIQTIARMNRFWTFL